MIIRDTYWHWEGQIAPISCNQLIEEACAIGFSDGSVGENAIDKDIRDCGVAWLPRMHMVESVLSHHGHIGNHSMGWNLDLSITAENVQIARYSEAHNQFYDLHTDLKFLSDVGDLERKMTAILMLSDPSDYDGGDLIIDRIPVTQKKQGTIIVFPSFYPHQVTPVTKGTRYSATCWIAGPRFK